MYHQARISPIRQPLPPPMMQMPGQTSPIIPVNPRHGLPPGPITSANARRDPPPGLRTPPPGLRTPLPTGAQRSASFPNVSQSQLDQPQSQGCCGIMLLVLSYFLIVITFPIAAFFCFKVVQQYQRAVVFRLGKLKSGRPSGPGIMFFVPCVDEYTLVDLRLVSFDVPEQEILSKDSVTVQVDAVIYFRIADPNRAVVHVSNATASTKLVAQTTLRNVLGTKTLAELLSEREQISRQMRVILDEATDSWGISVERVEVKEIRLPREMQRAMAAEAEASREARAKLIAAEGEQKASRALREAALTISETPTALQLRYLQTLNTISAEQNSTIIFPFPIDLLSAFIPIQPNVSSGVNYQSAKPSSVVSQTYQKIPTESEYEDGGRRNSSSQF